MSVSRKALIKAMQTLLIARVLVAPVVLLADGGGESLGTVLVVRACAWAAYQSRLTGGGAAACRGARAETAWPVATSPRIAASSRLPSGPPLSHLPSPGRDSRRSIARLRC